MIHGINELWDSVLFKEYNLVLCKYFERISNLVAKSWDFMQIQP